MPEEPSQTLLRRARRLIEFARKLADKDRHPSLRDLNGELLALQKACDDFEGEQGPARKDYTVTEQGEATREEHESFGMVSFARVSGSTRLFGSHLEQHHNYVVLQIRRAVVDHELARDWYHRDHCMPLVEVAMSSAQFAEAITTLNYGDGVPCTITHVDGVRMDPVPQDNAAENVKIRDAFARKLDRTVASIREIHDEIDRLVEVGSSVSKSRARDLRDIMAKYLRQVDRDAAFVLHSFQESAERVVQHAKSEIDATLTTSIQRAGIRQLSADEPPRLPPPDEQR